MLKCSQCTPKQTNLQSVVKVDWLEIKVDSIVVDIQGVRMNEQDNEISLLETRLRTARKQNETKQHENIVLTGR